MANWSVIIVGVTLIWQKAIATIHSNSYEAVLASFKFGGQTKNRQTTKLKSPPNILCIRYKWWLRMAAMEHDEVTQRAIVSTFIL